MLNEIKSMMASVAKQQTEFQALLESQGRRDEVMPKLMEQVQ